MEIKKLVDFDKVNDFLNHTFSSPTHWPDWNKLISRHFNTTFYCLAAYDEGKITGICPVHETRRCIKNILTTGQIYLNPYGGWLFNKESRIDLTKTPLHFGQAFQCFTLPAIPVFNVHYEGVEMKKHPTLIIDLRKSWEDVFNTDFESRNRNVIRKAIKNDVFIKIEKDIDRFYHYYLISSEKRNQKIIEKAFFKDLFENCSNISFEISWAYIGKQILGFDVICFDKDYAFGFWNFILPETPKVGQGNYIISESIKRSQSYGCSFFDFCFITLKDNFSGIYEFKKGFSKTEVQINYFIMKTLSYKIVNKIIK